MQTRTSLPKHFYLLSDFRLLQFHEFSHSSTQGLNLAPLTEKVEAVDKARGSKPASNIQIIHLDLIILYMNYIVFCPLRSTHQLVLESWINVHLFCSLKKWPDTSLEKNKQKTKLHY